jgi:uncharacterized delta-60 repeat protein
MDFDRRAFCKRVAAASLRARLRAVVVLVAVAGLILAGSAVALSGVLDPSFGSGGIVTTDFGPGANGVGTFSIVRALAFQPDRKILAAGELSDGGSPVTRAALVRYQANGKLDDSFGTAGKVVTDFLTALAVRVAPAGRILVAGGHGTQFALARYLSSGSLDSSFGAGGRMLSDFGASVRAVTFLPNGTILAVGTPTPGVFQVARYRENGTLDQSFGGGGKASVSFGSLGGANLIAVGRSGKIVVAGAVLSLDGKQRLAVARFNPNGTPDSSFGSGGKATVDVPGDYHALGVDADGRIIAAGLVVGGLPGWSFVVTRLRQDGGLDTGFGPGGVVVTDFGDASFADAESLVIDSAGRIVVAGQSDLGAFVLARYLTDGSLDPTFGFEGRLTTVVASGSGSSQGSGAFALAFQPDGKLLSAGTSDQGPPRGYTFTLVRYLSDP